MSTSPYCYEYPRPALTVDCVVFGVDAEIRLKVLLIRRTLPPFAGDWALPGGFVHVDESLDAAARRELSEETGLTDVFLEQLYSFGQVDRDPRDRVVSVAYYALINLVDRLIRAGTDAQEAVWVDLDRVPVLAFDHGQILEGAIARLRGKVRYEPIGFELLPQKFTLTQLQRLYEAILGTAIDKRNFRKKVLKLDILVALPEKQVGVAHRAAQLYGFDLEKYQQRKASGYHFEL
jgi:8-oxo-dGTP diphosphatase